MKIKQITYLFFGCLLFVNCNTYKTFYGETYSEVVFQPKVYRLDLSHQNLQDPPKYLENLKELKMLNLSGNTHLDLEVFFNKISEPEKLRVLILDSLSLKSLPKNISRFKNLKQLSLGYNPFLDLESAFNVLSGSQIEFLNLMGNDLNSIPENIKNLSFLEELNLSFNHISKEQDYLYLSELPLLKSIWLDHNNLEALPYTISSLSHLRNLYIDNNKLSNLPRQLSLLKKVRIIHASHNKFPELPVVFTEMEGLYLLHVNNCEIQTIPDVYKTKAYTLMGLTIDNNPITKSETEKKQWEKIFRRFFILSFGSDSD